MRCLEPHPGRATDDRQPEFRHLLHSRMGGYHDGSANVNPVSITVSTADFLVPVYNTWWVWAYWTNASGWGCPGDADVNCFTGYYRIRAWR